MIITKRVFICSNCKRESILENPSDTLESIVIKCPCGLSSEYKKHINFGDVYGRFSLPYVKTLLALQQTLYSNPLVLLALGSNPIGSHIAWARREFERQAEEESKRILYEKLYSHNMINPHDHQIDCNIYHGFLQSRNFGKTNLLQQLNSHGAIMADMKKFATGGIVPKIDNDKITTRLLGKNPFFQLLNDYPSFLTPPTKKDYDLCKRLSSFTKSNKAENYSFGVTCEEAVDLHKIAEDLNNDNYCFHVVTDNTPTPKVNAILVHRSIIRKAFILKMERPVGINFENFKTFGAFYISGHGHEVIKKADVPKKLDYTDYKRVMTWVSSVKKAKYSDHVNTRINGKPITVKVTNCSKID